MKAVMLSAIILSGILCVADEAKHRNDKWHIDLLIIIYSVIGLVVLL